MAIMKRLFLLASTLALLAGCATDRSTTYRGTTGAMGSGTDAGYGSGVAPTQQGAGAIGLTTVQLTSYEVNFLRSAAQDNQTDIQLGQTMVQRSGNPAVKNFGQRLADDHAAIKQQFQVIVAQKGVTLPTTPSAEQQQWLDQLSSFNGPQFDQAAIRQAILHEENEVQYYQQAVNMAQDPSVKAFAQSNLPVVQQDLALARQLETPLPTGSPSGTLMPEQQ
jgi:putative membrane protein